MLKNSKLGNFVILIYCQVLYTIDIVYQAGSGSAENQRTSNSETAMATLHFAKAGSISCWFCTQDAARMVMRQRTIGLTVQVHASRVDKTSTSKKIAAPWFPSVSAERVQVKNPLPVVRDRPHYPCFRLRRLGS